jgi:ribosomal protein L24
LHSWKVKGTAGRITSIKEKDNRHIVEMYKVRKKQ